MKLPESTKNKITKDKNDENVPRPEITEVILVHCNLINNSYQKNLRALYTFVPNKSFCQLLEISSKNFIFLKTFSSKFSYIEIWFTDQNSKPLEIEDKINITLVINWYLTYKKIRHSSSLQTPPLDLAMRRCSIEPRNQIFLKGYWFLSFAKSIGKTMSKNLSGKYSQ